MLVLRAVSDGMRFDFYILPSIERIKDSPQFSRILDDLRGLFPRLQRSTHDDDDDDDDDDDYDYDYDDDDDDDDDAVNKKAAVITPESAETAWNYYYDFYYHCCYKLHLLLARRLYLLLLLLFTTPASSYSNS